MALPTLAGIHLEIQPDKTGDPVVNRIASTTPKLPCYFDEIRNNELQKKLLKETDNKKATNLVYVGTAITLIGLILTLGTYTGLIRTVDSFIIAYGPFLGGLSILFMGLAKRKRG